MSGKKLIVELFVNTNKGVVMDSHRQNLPPFRQIYGKKSQTWDAERNLEGLSAREIEILAWLDGLQDEYCFELKVYDIERTRHMFHAGRRKVRQIPTVIIGDRTFAGNIDRAQVLKCLDGVRNKD
jgi:hypothetical protein